MKENIKFGRKKQYGKKTLLRKNIHTNENWNRTEKQTEKTCGEKSENTHQYMFHNTPDTTKGDIHVHQQQQKKQMPRSPSDNQIMQNENTRISSGNF